MAILDSIADLSFVACCAIQLLPTMSIPSWLWIWAGIIVIIKIVNQIIALTRIKQFYLLPVGGKLIQYDSIALTLGLDPKTNEPISIDLEGKRNTT